MTTLAELYLTDARQRLRGLKTLGEGALAQLRNDEWHAPLAPDGNSPAVLIRHLSGNMHARWGALAGGYREGTEGEPAGRNRDEEFGETTHSPADLMGIWEAGWAVFLGALDHLTAEDLTRSMTIRGETHTVLAAVQRQVMHYSGHVYQLVLLARTRRGADWQTLSIARGGSAAYNASRFSR